MAVLRGTEEHAEGSTTLEVRQQVNLLATKLNALLAKLDLDAGITDTNYLALIGTSDTVLDWSE